MRQRYDRYKWLLWGTALVIVGFVAMRGYDGQGADEYVIILLAATLVLAVLVQLVMTQRWTARATGVLYTVLGTAVLEVATLINYYDRQSRAWNESAGDIVRAMWIAGPVLMLYGMVLYLVSWWRHRHHPPDHPP